jgi:diguanylate cyclase (GGDEF)-like protein/PAS domain S-box-containing protein
MDVKVLEKLIEIGRGLAEKRVLASLLEHAMSEALGLLKGEKGYLILLTPRGELDFRIRQDAQGKRLDNPTEQISRTIFDQAISQRRSMLIADAVIDPNLQRSESVLNLGLRSVVCAPVIAHEKLLGALYVENRSDRAIFDENDLKALEYFAALLAVSIENAQFNAELERRVEEQTRELKSALEKVALYSGQLLSSNKELAKEISARRQAQDQLRKLSRVIEQSSNGVIIVDTNHQIEYVNPAFTTMTGYSFEEVVGQSVEDSKQAIGLTEVDPSVWDKLAAGELLEHEVHYKKKTGEAYWERLVLASIRSSEGGISHFAIIKEDITLKKMAADELREIAISDPLTGLYNRRHFFSEAERAFQHVLRYKEPLTVLMIDVDHFKNINDTHGHQVGDEVLKALGMRLRHSVRAADTIGRYGGEEFAIVMPVTQVSAAQLMAERLCKRLAEEPVQTLHGPLNLTVSIGVAAYALENDRSLSDVLAKADQALYAAKAAGRNRVEVWSQTQPLV